MPTKLNKRDLLKPLSVLIVEDDLSFAIELDMLVREIGYDVKGRVDNSAEALEIALTDAPDLILMDIEIKGRLNGLELAEKITHLGIPILFITSHNNDADYERAKQTSFIGYLVKPVNKYSLKSAIKLAMTTLRESNTAGVNNELFTTQQHLFFKRKGVYQKVKIKDIHFIEGAGDYSICHAEGGRFVSSLRLKELEEMLISHGFYRIHRSYLANLVATTSIDVTNNELTISGKIIPFSRRSKHELIQKLPLIQ